MSTTYRGVLVDSDFSLGVERVQHAVVVQLTTGQLLGDHVIAQHVLQQRRVRGQLLHQVRRKSLETKRTESLEGDSVASLASLRVESTLVTGARRHCVVTRTVVGQRLKQSQIFVQPVMS